MILYTGDEESMSRNMVVRDDAPCGTHKRPLRIVALRPSTWAQILLRIFSPFLPFDSRRSLSRSLRTSARSFLVARYLNDPHAQGFTSF